MKRWRWVMLTWGVTLLLWLLFAGSFNIVAGDVDAGQTIPPLDPFEKKVHSASGRDAKAYSGELVTYTILLSNTKEVSYTAKVGVTDTVPFSLTDIQIQPPPVGQAVLSGNQITWVLDVEYGKQYGLTYTARAPEVTAQVRLTNTAELYEIANAWAPTPTQMTTATHSVLIVESIPSIYLPMIIKTEKVALPSFKNFNFEEGTGVGWSEKINDNRGRLIFERVNGYPAELKDPSHFAWLSGAFSRTNELSQAITLSVGTPPFDYESLGLTYLYYIDSGEASTGRDWAEVRILVDGQAPTLLKKYELWRDANTEWSREVITDLTEFKGNQITLSFLATFNPTVNSNFLIDKVEICSNDVLRNPPDARRCDNTDIP